MSQSNTAGEDTPQETTGRTVVGLFAHRSAAEAAIRDLQAAGFAEERIGVAMQERVEQGDLLDDGAGPAGHETAEGAVKGAVSGGLVGGLLGLLGSLLIPGLGPVLAGGVLASTLAGVGIGAATGGLLGALIALGVPEEDARHFDRGFREGGTLVTVDAGARTPEALAILSRHEVDLGPGGHARYGERRIGLDPSYAGPERRLVGV
jgi:hypothetical protein